MLRDGLEQIEEETILIVLEDFILKRRVDTNRLQAMYSLFINDNLEMLRLIPRPRPRAPKSDKPYGIISLDEPYRVSTQAAFWRKSVLMNLLKSDESPWIFELMGSKRSYEYYKFAALYNYALPYYHHDIQGGKWFPWSILYLKYLGIKVDTQRRPSIPLAHALMFVLKKIIIKLFNASK